MKLLSHHLCRNPDPGNSKVLSSLSEGQQQHLDKIQQLAEVYGHNACTPDIHNYLADRMKAVGVFGMLRECRVPLMHGGIKLGPYQAGADLEKLSMCPADAEAYLQELLGKVQNCNAAIFGQLHSCNTPPLLLQSAVDLMCCNWDRLKLLQSAPPGQQAAAGLRSACEAVTSALQAAAAVAAATARGDIAAAEAAVVTAQQAAAMVQQQAQHLAAGLEDTPELLLSEELPDAQELSLPHTEEVQPLAEEPGVLGRGTGLVYLLWNSWGSRAKLLDAAVKVGGKVFTHITLGMLTARKGLNLGSRSRLPSRWHLTLSVPAAAAAPGVPKQLLCLRTLTYCCGPSPCSPFQGLSSALRSSLATKYCMEMPSAHRPSQVP